MRRILGLASLVTLASACSLRPWTPSVSVAFWAEDVPVHRDVALPTPADVAQAWHLPASDPWAPYTKGTLIGALGVMGTVAPLPDVRALEVVARAEAAAARVAARGLPSDALFVVDLRGAASCAFAARLSRDAKERVSPVVTFNNWPAEDAIVPADETLAGLLAFRPKDPATWEGDTSTPTTPVLLLDAWRLAYRFDDPGDDVFDNRYMLMPADLPDASALAARGIRRVIYVVEDLDDAEVEEDDLNVPFRAWQASGVPIFMVDLAFLEAATPSSAGADWSVVLRPQAYVPRTRYTLVDDPYFYARARAGFGFGFGGRSVFVPGRGYGPRGSGGGSGGG